MIRDGVYMDDVGIVNKSPCINASRWKLGDGNELIIVGNKNCIAGCRICVEITQPVSIFSEDIDGNSHNLKYEYNAGCIEVYLPESRVIYLLICE
ncbi:MAG TPA: hypothetical protein DIW17_05325 [Clostridiales bacterium]|nr:hypothetical protein [Clostridiales bacterium]